MNKATLWFLLLVAAFPFTIQAQNNTSVTATVVGPNSAPWANATGYASLVCPGNAQAYIGTSPVPRTSPTVGFDSNGHFTQVLYNTAVLVDVNKNPISCSYQYHITDQCGTNAFITPSLTGITGAGPVDLSGQINAAAPNPCVPSGGGAASPPNNSLQYNKAGSLGGTGYLYNPTDNQSAASGANCPSIPCQSITPSADPTLGLYYNSQGLQINSSFVVAGNIKDSGLTAGNCVQAGTGGVLTTIAAACNAPTGVVLGNNIQTFGNFQGSGANNGSGTTATVGGTAGSNAFAIACGQSQNNVTFGTPGGGWTALANSCYGNTLSVGATTVTQTVPSGGTWTDTLSILTTTGSTPTVTTVTSGSCFASGPGTTCTATPAGVSGGATLFINNYCASGLSWVPMNEAISDNLGDVFQLLSTNQNASGSTGAAEWNWMVASAVGGSTTFTVAQLVGPSNNTLCQFQVFTVTNISSLVPGSYTLQSSDGSKIVQFEGNANVNLTLPAAFSAGYASLISNDTAGGTVTFSSAQKINGTGIPVTIIPGEQTWVVSDGTNWFTSQGQPPGTPVPSVSRFDAGNFTGVFTTSVTNAAISPRLSFIPVTQSQNTVYAAPAASNGTATFRFLAQADIPAGVAANANLAFTNRNLPGNVSIGASSTTTVDSVTLGALPAACATNGCRLRVSYSYYFSGGTQGWCWVTDGTVNSRAANDLSNNNGNQESCQDNVILPATYSSGATPTISTKVNNLGAQTACAQTGTAAPCNVANANVTLNSNMQIEVILSN
jgi:hypothetical protein